MREQRRVFEKISKINKNKTELATQKVELGLIDDLEKKIDKFAQVMKEADNSWEEYQNYLTRADKPFKKMISKREELSKAYGQIDSDVRKVRSLAKDLGVEVDSLSSVETYMRTAMNIMSTIDSFKDPSSFQ